MNGATCVPASNYLDYHCVCPSVLALTGKHCEILLTTAARKLFVYLSKNIDFITKKCLFIAVVNNLCVQVPGLCENGGT